MTNELDTIPKVIHYFWFGNRKKPEIFYKCLDTWKKICPDYEIKEWNESNFDINVNEYIKGAYSKGKYAFVSDYARFYILYRYGGIYLDIDVEIIKNIDDLLENDMFVGFEDRNKVAPGLIMGAKKGEKVLKDILDIYNSFKEFPSYEHNVCDIMTEYLIKNKNLDVNNKNIQKLDGITIYPMEYFCACDLITKKINITDNTYSVHHYNASWLSPKDKIKNFIRLLVYKILGKDNYNKLKRKVKGK